MGRGKLAKFADMADNPLVVECPMAALMQEDFPLRGRWREDFFHNPNPIVLELGCGRGEYTVGLARKWKDKNYVGVDIKGARMWTGAQDALKEGMGNVAFLRTNIEFIHRFFDHGEVSEIWLTFSDPQMKKVTKRLTSTYFLERYRQFMPDGGTVHLKTDSNFLFSYTEEMLRANGIVPDVSTRNLYGTEDRAEDCMAQLSDAAAIQTYYEQMWMERGIPIKYMRFGLPQQGRLVEPDVEIPLDEYRSYGRHKRSGLDVGK